MGTVDGDCIATAVRVLIAAMGTSVVLLGEIMGAWVREEGEIIGVSVAPGEAPVQGQHSA